MIGIEYCQAQLGKPWVSGARGPEEFDCWGLLVSIYKEVLGHQLDPHFGVDAKNIREVLRTVDSEIPRWVEIPRPRHLCAVGMSTGRHVAHVGVWLDHEDGGVIHAASGRGVTFQSRISLRGIGINNLTFYSYDPGSTRH